MYNNQQSVKKILFFRICSMRFIAGIDLFGRKIDTIVIKLVLYRNIFKILNAGYDFSIFRKIE
jgi:hypothetical protein